MKVFCQWIDEYKKRVGWSQLFYSPHSPQNRDIKYHDLPIAMQVGIFWQFTLEIEPKSFKKYREFIDVDGLYSIWSMDQIVERIREWFKEETEWQAAIGNSEML